MSISRGIDLQSEWWYCCYCVWQANNRRKKERHTRVREMRVYLRVAIGIFMVRFFFFFIQHHHFHPSVREPIVYIHSEQLIPNFPSSSFLLMFLSSTIFIFPFLLLLVQPAFDSVLGGFFFFGGKIIHNFYFSRSFVYEQRPQKERYFCCCCSLFRARLAGV